MFVTVQYQFIYLIFASQYSHNYITPNGLVIIPSFTIYLRIFPYILHIAFIESNSRH